jgi:hypothetical protein
MLSGIFVPDKLLQNPGYRKNDKMLDFTLCNFVFAYFINFTYRHLRLNNADICNQDNFGLSSYLL